MGIIVLSDLLSCAIVRSLSSLQPLKFKENRSEEYNRLDDP